MVGICHENVVMSSKINMLNQIKCFFISLGSEKGFNEKQFSESCAKLSTNKRPRTKSSNKLGLSF